jgi:hypothetical protein
MNVRGLLFACCLSVGFQGNAQQSASKADKQPYSLLMTIKLHSTGHSIYSGLYFNNHLNAEMGLSYKYKRIGAFITKNVDIADVRSSINTATIGVFKTFQVSESIQLVPYLGYFLRQSYSLADKQSDAWTCLAIRFTINRFFIVENTALVGNLIRHHSKASLANRINGALLLGNFRIDAYAWYSQSLYSTRHFVSASVAVTSPDWVISPFVSIRLQASMIQHISNKKPEGVMQRGGLISLIVPVNLSIHHVGKQVLDVLKL